MLPQLYCLRWKYHHSNLQDMFSQLLDRGCFCDVTLACEGQLIRAHRVVLCACSTFFDQLLTNYPTDKDPIIIMKDAKFAEVKCLIEFMYKGEINVEHCKLTSLLKTAEDLKIKGLAEVTFRDDENEPLIQPEASLDSPSGEEETTVMAAVPHMPQLTPIVIPNVEGQKRKRGRPPLDDSYEAFSGPKISHVEGSASSSNHYPDTPTTHNQTVLEDGTTLNQIEDDDPLEDEHNWTMPTVEMPMETKQEKDVDAVPNPEDEYYERIEGEPSARNGNEQESEAPFNLPGVSEPVLDSNELDGIDLTELNMTAAEVMKIRDIVKMDTYVAKGRRPQFWEDPFTRRVIELIRHKKLEMKKAAKLLGVSYGTLYGRYREVYGCLKHPYRGTPLLSRYDIWKNKQHHGAAVLDLKAINKNWLK